MGMIWNSRMELAKHCGGYSLWNNLNISFTINYILIRSWYGWDGCIFIGGSVVAVVGESDIMVVIIWRRMKGCC